ncbi:MAG: alpha/beta hydrolase family protein [Candidatus Nitrosocosmicus sp.]
MLLLRFKRKPLMVLGIFFGTFLILLTYLSSLFSSSLFPDALAQSNIQTVKYRNLTLDLGNGVSTNAQLSYPAIGKGPFPGVLLIHGSGANDMNETGGLILIDNKTGSKIYPEKQTFFQLAEYLSERGFAVLKYDKRGVEPNFTTVNNIWGNVTFNDLKQDAEKALLVLLEQSEVNASKKATLIGHSEGTMIAPRVAVDNSDKVKNIVLMGPVANTLPELLYFQIVKNPLDYTEKVLDKNDSGILTISEISNDQIFENLVGGNLTHLLLYHTNGMDYLNKSSTVKSHPNNTTISKNTISIENNLKPALIAAYNNVTFPTDSALISKCLDVHYGYFEWNSGLEGCPKWMRSHSDLQSTLSIIGNISSDIGILILQGENDTATPLEQGLQLQQRLMEVNHPDHLLITYPDLGHSLSPSSNWISQSGPLTEYVLKDIFEWLSSRSG